MIVLDASAVLALIHDEPGADAVEKRLEGAAMSAVNLAEVVGKLVDSGVEARSVRPLLDSLGLEVHAVTVDDGELAGALRALPGGDRLSLGDRCCLALALRLPAGEVLTADAAWSDLDLPLTIVQIRHGGGGAWQRPVDGRLD